MAHRILDFGEKPAMNNSILIKLKLCRDYSDKGAIYYVKIAMVIYVPLTNRVKGLAPVVQTMDSAVHRINHYPADKH